MDTVLKMLLIAFVSLLAFSSGVYFGKQMSDSDHQLKALESDFNTQSTLNASNEESDEQMSDEEVAALSDKYVNAEKENAKREVASTTEDEHAAPSAHAAATAEHPNAHEAAAPKAHEAETEEHAAPAAHSAPAAHAAPAHSASAPDLSAAHRAAERVANNASPLSNKPDVAPKPTENRVPTSLPKTVGTNGTVEFTVQVASYPTAEAAKAYANDLVKKGFPAFPVEANVNGRTWYRVSVGSFKTMKDATTYRAQLLKQADLQNAIVQKITR
jgi:cell division protein FtsN